MKKTLLFTLIATALFSMISEAKYVRVYYKKDGTYVSGYNRSSADSTKINNYSTKGNINPYTGSKGYKSPY